ncbi:MULTISPECIES: prepilin peptidase [Mycobacteriaceae]|uniref:Peptidase A24 n=1 Tax=Mycolicibacterium neoaurum VKM Ac-1815D TaxID=700508 RepID=V5XDB0_MYCNE|nr:MULTISPECIES: A24 family peptidase [Mycobacteriaceae]AHC25404.1 peptidase A24 [Mycolicibacterium neoaurum VKM Ac-1815D]KJQ47861.1 peptidase A24 [Mycolicibacterium neoaurum]
MGWVAVGVWLTALTVYDLRQRRLPNMLTLPGALLVLCWAASCGRGMPALVGALALFGSYLAIHLAVPDHLGAGDVKLALGVGALTGAFGIDVWALAALAAPLLTATWALTARLFGRTDPLPHGPAMCVASAVAVVLAVGR